MGHTSGKAGLGWGRGEVGEWFQPTQSNPGQNNIFHQEFAARAQYC